MAELHLLHEATVGEEEIDHLGHMNVRFYLEKALEANRVLLETHGLTADHLQELDAVVQLGEVYTRHYREQMAGARLAVMGGVLDIGGDSLRAYHELVNPERDERAATYIHTLSLRDRRTRSPLSLPEMFVDAASHAMVALPEHGRPRTVDLDERPTSLSLADAQDRRLEMRQASRVRPEECDGDGFFVAARYQDLVWRGELLPDRPSGPFLFDTADGRKMGWATLESWAILLELPRAGARIQTFSAEVALAEKTSFRHGWVFDLDSARLLCTSSIVNLAFDIGGRRAMVIPTSVREMLAPMVHPDLR